MFSIAIPLKCQNLDNVNAANARSSLAHTQGGSQGTRRSARLHIIKQSKLFVRKSVPAGRLNGYHH